MDRFEKYLARMAAEGDDLEVLEKLRHEAEQSLREDPPEQALTLTGQLVGAMLTVARKQDSPQQELVDAVNALTSVLADYVEHLGWRQWATKTEAGWVYERSPSGN